MSHGLIWWVLVGVIAGALAKAVTPGSKSEPKGCLMTMVLGIAGSLLVGALVIGSGGFVASIVGATIGAVVLILLARNLWK